MPQGQAVDVRERQCVVQLQEYFDQERRQGPTVSTQDAVGRVAQALGLGKRTVKEILRTYRQTGQVSHGRRRRYANEMKWSLPGEPISVPNGPIAMPTAVPCVPKCISMRVISMLTIQRHARGTSLKTDHGCTNPQAKARV